MQILGFELDADTFDFLEKKALTVLLFLPKVLLALLVVILGCRIINCISSRLETRLQSLGKTSKGAKLEDEESQSSTSTRGSTRHLTAKLKSEAQLDPTLVKFAVSFFSNALKCLLLLQGAAMVNIQTTSFLAVLAMSSLAVGMAMQGMLQDLAAGVMLLVFRPYQLGDLIQAAKQTGRVSEIGMFETTMLSLDNKTIIIPNSQISIVTNLSTQEMIRVDVALKISHSASLRQAKEVLLRVAQESPYVLPDRAPAVLVSGTSELGRDLIIRAYVRSSDYIPAPFMLREQALLALDEANVSLASMPLLYPYPKQELQSPV
eukprot:CAMPEP_0197658504 /NCGR_PEP_ID=MMETSP1338-20131121/45277_1 /TAXON_ID=43686 ORGANISM="Pelagodinium beii, Strain RCC1491" /NCGR_SAMPLE_ID=MMETSP1338 /ASSEMBLY_ACC=CAM_ASM_000754 /LENGTH=318 /DNA_ID=CAMNT_0043235105 /DNA_START=76 /DNA_END=1032 /DNA_ORIENTATION=-